MCTGEVRVVCVCDKYLRLAVEEREDDADVLRLLVRVRLHELLEELHDDKLEDVVLALSWEECCCRFVVRDQPSGSSVLL